MAEEAKSLFYKIKPLSDRLPSVAQPEGHVHFRMKILWVAAALITYFFLSNVYVYGLDQTKTLDLFAQYRTIMAGSSGSLLQLGIGPIVTASIVMQLLVGSKIVNLDLTKKEDKDCYHSVLKLLVIFMIFVEAIPQVFGYLIPSDQFASKFTLSGARALIVLQIAIGSYFVFLMDEVISKWGIGSGISLFIAAGVAESLFTGTLNWNPVLPNAETSLSNPPAGTIPKVIYFLVACSPAQFSDYGYQEILIGQPNPLIALIGTICIFLVVAYLESVRIELPISHGSARGVRGKYPIKLIYASNIPVILMSALLANISMLALLLYNNDILSKIPFLGHNPILGYFRDGNTSAAGGLAWYLSAPSGITSWLVPIFNPTIDGNIHSPLMNIMRVVIYTSVMILGSVLFAKFWVNTTNMNSRAVAAKIQRSGMHISGFRSDTRVIEQILEKYIPTVTVLSGAIVGALAAFADLIGTTGGASGTGVLLTVGILIRFYETIGREQMMEMNPMVREFFGG
ncbi:MAG: preprotein translocase subunit SecY [archaeon]|nr:preprotein translocase subunit SecY [archaeon]